MLGWYEASVVVSCGPPVLLADTYLDAKFGCHLIVSLVCMLYNEVQTFSLRLKLSQSSSLTLCTHGASWEGAGTKLPSQVLNGIPAQAVLSAETTCRCNSLHVQLFCIGKIQEKEVHSSKGCMSLFLKLNVGLAMRVCEHKLMYTCGHAVSCQGSTYAHSRESFHQEVPSWRIENCWSRYTLAWPHNQKGCLSMHPDRPANTPHDS